MNHQKHLYTHTIESNKYFLKTHFQGLAMSMKNPSLSEVFQRQATRQLKTNMHFD